MNRFVSYGILKTMMTKLTTLLMTGLASAATWAVITPAAQALSFDMGEATCADLLSIEDDATASFVVTWLDGYLSGITGDTTFDTDFLEGFVEVLVEACAASPDSIVLDVAEEVGTSDE